jgi:hypothetical protein
MSHRPNTDGRQLRVFLCHATTDKPSVRVLWTRLREAGFDSWLDEENLLPGQEWEAAVKKAIRESDVVLVCLSRYAVSAAGFRHREIQSALNVAEEKPEGSVFIIPVKLEECPLPDRLKHLHCSNLVDRNGFDKLIQSLSECAHSKKLSPVTPQVVLILYAVSTWLSYVVAQEYFGGYHHVRCSPNYSSPDFAGAPSASPGAIYAKLAEAVNNGDRHAMTIRLFSENLRKEARDRVTAGELDEKQYKVIDDIIRVAETKDFKPLLYVIPFAGIENIVAETPIQERAHPLSREYVIARLPRHLFDIVDFMD